MHLVEVLAERASLRFNSGGQQGVTRSEASGRVQKMLVG